MTPRGLRLADAMIDVVHALDIEGVDDTVGGLAVMTAVQSLVDAGLFEVVVQDDRAGFGIELRPFLEAIITPTLLLARQLATNAGTSLEDVLGELRHALDATERPS